MSLTETLKRIQETEGFYVKQNWDALEQITTGCCYEQSNTYEVYNIPAQEYRKKGMEGDIKIMTAVEKTGFCARCCCGEHRAFDFTFETSQSKEAFVRLHRGWRGLGWALIPCCAHRVNVNSAVQVNEENNLEIVGGSDNLNLAGYVQVPPFHGGCCIPKFDLYDEASKKVGYIWGYSCCCCPCIVCDFCGAEFGVYKNGVNVGQLKKRGVATCKDYLYEMNTEADKFTVEFTEAALKNGDIDTNFKLTVLAAVLQIDFNFFEDKRGIRECRCCDVACCGYAVACLPSPLLALCGAINYILCCWCRDEEKEKEKKKKKQDSRLLE